MTAPRGIDGSGLEEEVRQTARLFGPEDGERITREAGRLAAFLSLLLDANARFNLVSRNSASPPALIGHLIDALSGLGYLPAERSDRGLRLLDIGSGGGFPAIPLLVVRRDLEGWLVESTGKKARFLQEVGERLALTSSVVNARFPFPQPMKEIPAIDVVTTRAVAGAGRIARAARPLCAPGARMLLWTTEALFGQAVRESGFQRSAFHGTPGRSHAGIAVLECST